MARAMWAWGDLNPKAMRVMSLILVFIIIWSPLRDSLVRWAVLCR